MKKAFSKETEIRKKEHLKIALSGKAQVGSNGFELYKYTHNSLPEIDFDKIETSTTFLNKKVTHPFFISCMTGGILEGGKLNINLSKAAEKHGIALGIGSQRAAIEAPQLSKYYNVRKYAPTIPILANIGLVQLNYGYVIKEFLRCVDMIKADALVVHINPLQEVIQPEGNRNWSGLLEKLEKLTKNLNVPIIVKEVGFGMSENVIQRLIKVGVCYIDCAGWGGTNWAMVEGLRGKADKETGSLFADWGIPTAESIENFNKVKQKFFKNNISLLASGGIRNGIEIAKCLSLGAVMVGIATPFAKAGVKSPEAVGELIEKYAEQLKITMFGVGAKNIEQLKNIKLQKVS
jgi:isopentenyl-diphosphate delta-isomerase